MAQLAAYPVRVRFPVHWAEMDAMGHVNNARYFTWFESARLALFRRVGIADRGGDGVGPILAHTSCDFLVPVTWPATIEVGTRITQVGRTSFTMEYVAWSLGDPEENVDGGASSPVARGTGVVVLIDYGRGRSVPISDDLRQALDALR